MSVLKSPARLLAADGSPIGEGRAYLHLRLPEAQPQSATGTLSLDWWNDVEVSQDARLQPGTPPRQGGGPGGGGPPRCAGWGTPPPPAGGVKGRSPWPRSGLPKH